MIRRLFILLLFISYYYNTSAQNINTPDDIEQIMGKSSKHYVIDTTLSAYISYNNPLVEKGWYQFNAPEGIQLVHTSIRTHNKSEKYQKKAIKFFLKEKYAKAFDLYLEALQYNADDLGVLKQLGICKLKLGNYEEAIYYLERGFAINPIDIQINEQLALCFSKSDEKEKAIRYITRAHLLNRNDTQLLDTLIELYKSNNLSYQNWVFEPQFQISEGEANQVLISADKVPWRAYAACKAVWLFEMDHKNRMKQISSEKIGEIEEKECLLNALIAYERMEIKDELAPAFESLSSALINRQINNFILYEISARNQPEQLSKLSAEKMDQLVDYVINYKTFKLQAIKH